MSPFEYKNISVSLESPGIPREDVEKIIDFLWREKQFIADVNKFKWHSNNITLGKEKTLFKKIVLGLDEKEFIVTIKNSTSRIEHIGSARKEKGIAILKIIPLSAQISHGIKLKIG